MTGLTCHAVPARSDTDRRRQQAAELPGWTPTDAWLIATSAAASVAGVRIVVHFTILINEAAWRLVP